MTHKTKNVPKGPRNSTMFVFFSKNAYFSCFRMISVFSWMQRGIRGCSKGAADVARVCADAARDPRLRFCPTPLGRDCTVKIETLNFN